MEYKQLLDQLDHLGYPLMETTESFDVNKTLAEVVKTKNVRLLEGFPVMLVNAAKKDGFDLDKVEGLLGNQKNKEVFKDMVLLSLTLYKTSNFYFDWAKTYEGKLTQRQRNKIKAFRGSLQYGSNVKVRHYELDPERLKQVLKNYSVHQNDEFKALNVKHEDLSLEFALSQVFSPKQKELFKKKLKGDVLTKTEKEYFSRAVKKKVSALANPELHRLAQRILEL